MRTTEELIQRLNSLMQLDYDAVQAYEKAIDKIDVGAIANQLQAFQADHERHLVDLSMLIRSLGGEPIELERDVKGVLIEAMTAVRSALGTKQALKAMRSNEQLTNKTYQDALDEVLPPEVERVVLRNREDERLHLDYIERAIEQLGGEAEAPAPTVR